MDDSGTYKGLPTPPASCVCIPGQVQLPGLVSMAFCAPFYREKGFLLQSCQVLTL